MKLFLSLLVGFVMVAGGAAHLAMPANFSPLVPAFLPAPVIILGTGLMQIAIGLIASWPKTRACGGLAFAALCLAYLPLHLWDYVREVPVFAPPVAATLRVIVQLIFIWAGYSLWQRARSPANV